MEKENESHYEVRYTTLSKQHFYELLDYFYQYYPLERAEQVANELEQKAMSLRYQPYRGRKVEELNEEPLEYRFVLYQRTRGADIKIIYCVDEKSKTVYLVDFFPTERDSDAIGNRID